MQCRFDLITGVGAASDLHGVSERSHGLHPKAVMASRLGNGPRRQKARLAQVASNECGSQATASRSDNTVEGEFTKGDHVHRSRREFAARSEYPESDWQVVGRSHFGDVGG